MTDEARIRQLEKIRALLNQAESTTFPEEARAYTEKAQDLMTRYALSDADLRQLGDAGAPDTVESRTIKVYAPHTLAKGHLFNAAAEGNGCKIVFGDSDVTHARTDGGVYRKLSQNERYRPLYVTGFSRDIDNAEMLFTSLLVQATKELLTTPCPLYENKRTFNKSFLIGYATEIAARLRERRRAVARDTVVTGVDGIEHNLLPVLADRSAQVQDVYEQRWQGKVAKMSNGVIRGGGYAAGGKAGSRANIGDPGLGGNRRALGQ